MPSSPSGSNPSEISTPHAGTTWSAATTTSQSTIGSAASPGTEVLLTCSIARTATPERVMAVLRSSAPATTVIDVTAEVVRGLRVVEDDVLVATGLLDDVRVELLAGVLVHTVAMAPVHAETVRRTWRSLLEQVPERWQVRTRAPLVAGDDSEPEPDVTVIPEADHSDHHPTSALLVVRSPARPWRSTSAKARVHAAVGVPDHWVLDVVAGRLHPHRAASPQGYGRVTVHEDGVVTTSGEPSLALDLDAVLLSG